MSATASAKRLDFPSATGSAKTLDSSVGDVVGLDVGAGVGVTVGAGVGGEHVFGGEVGRGVRLGVGAVEGLFAVGFDVGAPVL